MRVVATNKEDPNFSAPPKEKDEAAQRTQYSWGELMDEISPELPPLLESDPFPRYKKEDEDDETIARLLEEDSEEEEEDAILPPNLSSRLSSVTGESPTPIQGDLDLIKMCRRVAAKLSIDWLSQQEGQGTERDLYDGKSPPPQSQGSPILHLSFTARTDREAFCFSVPKNLPLIYVGCQSFKRHLTAHSISG